MIKAPWGMWVHETCLVSVYKEAESSSVGRTCSTAMETSQRTRSVRPKFPPVFFKSYNISGHGMALNSYLIFILYISTVFPLFSFINADQTVILCIHIFLVVVSFLTNEEFVVLCPNNCSFKVIFIIIIIHYTTYTLIKP